MDLSPKDKERNAQINKWNLIKLKSFCIAKETIHKMRRQSSEWEEVFENEAKKKGLNLQNIQIAHTAQYQKNKQPSQKMDK